MCSTQKAKSHKLLLPRTWCLWESNQEPALLAPRPRQIEMTSGTSEHPGLSLCFVPSGNEDIALFLLRHGAYFCSYILLDSPDPSKRLLRKYFIEASALPSSYPGKTVSDVACGLGLGHSFGQDFLQAFFTMFLNWLSRSFFKNIPLNLIRF